MDRIDKPKALYMILGMLFAISFPFVLFIVEPHFPGLLRYGYLEKSIIWIWLLLVYIYTTKIEKQPFLLWPDKKRPFRFYIISVISVSGLAFLAGESQQILPRFGFKTRPSQVLNEMASYLHTHPLLLVLTCLTAGIVEELLFRGYLIPRLNKLLKNGYLAVVVSALIFGAGHIGYGTWMNMIVPFLIGLIFGGYYQKYKNLKVLIFCHFLIDLLSMLS
jgi:membrane protease YdiL (CAAX protease family)